MKITCLPKMCLVAAAAIFLPQGAMSASINLGTAADFAILAGTAVTFAPLTTTVTGDVGVSTGTSITGVPANLTLMGSSAIHNNDGVAAQAQLDLTAAYLVAAATPFTATLPNIINTQTLVAGVYNFTTPTTTTTLTGALTLSGPGLFVFQMGADLQTAIGSRVDFINGATPCNVIWQVGSSANLLGSDFAGSILALTSITVGDGVTVDGRLLARNGLVSLIHDTITAGPCQPGEDLPNGQGVPDSGSTLLLLGTALATLLGVIRRFPSLR